MGYAPLGRSIFHKCYNLHSGIYTAVFTPYQNYRMSRSMTESAQNRMNARLQEIEAKIVTLTKERDEIRSALDIVARYAAPTKSITPYDIVKEEAHDAPSTTQGTPRPDGIPTMWGMTKKFFATRQTATATDIVAFMREHYWPGVVHAQVGPSLYRFVKEGRLQKIGRGKFSLPPKENDPPEGGSDSGEVSPSSDIQSETRHGLPSVSSPDPAGQTRHWKLPGI